ncbi:hypothetical protein TSUD_273010 [Trifolium subterraneum]|uniref:Small ribosomal subunit protein mS23 n=1 Tax=Trifolium subterraneum TaxID=3900 RepID=A0A2Z6LSN6_TRISU|nr:hypothetical protein TSUD_273010 [Trifolium subterraneum]
MSFMKGDLLSRTRKLVKGLAKAEPVWLKAMEQAPPATFPRPQGKIQTITLPEDVYVKRFCAIDPPPSRIFASRVLDLKEQGIGEEEAMDVADMEYLAEKKAKKKAYARLKQIARLQGKRLPPNPYPCPIKEIQAEERKYVSERFFDHKILEIVKQKKAEKEEFKQRRFGGGN